jgi:hypothetical protein
MKWVGVTIGLTALWMVTRAVVFYFVGVVAVFATAFQATVHALTKIGQSDSADETRAVRELRVERDARLTDSLIDLTAAEEPQKSVV